MTYQEVLAAARTCSGPSCKACPVCNGRACGSTMPGPGAKGTGTVAIRNYEAWQNIDLNMDTICENKPVDTTFQFFGETYALPVFAGPVGAVNLHYGDKYNDLEYNNILVPACVQAGIAAFTGDGTNPDVFTAASAAIGAAGGKGIPTVKPWDKDTLYAKLDAAKASGAKVFAMDIDAAGLPFLKGLTPPAGSKTVAELREIIEYIKQADVISIQMGSNDAFVPTVVAFGNATNWKSEDLASIVLSGNLRSKDPETKAAFDASMKKLKLTKSEVDAVWNLATSGMSKICNNAYPVSSANIRTVVETVRALNPDAQILLIGATNPVPLLPSWSNYFSKLNKFQKQLAEVYDIDYIAIPYAQTELDGHPTVAGHKYIAKKIVRAIQNG